MQCSHRNGYEYFNSYIYLFINLITTKVLGGGQVTRVPVKSITLQLNSNDKNLTRTGDGPPSLQLFVYIKRIDGNCY